MVHSYGTYDIVHGPYDIQYAILPGTYQLAIGQVCFWINGNYEHLGQNKIGAFLVMGAIVSLVLMRSILFSHGYSQWYVMHRTFDLNYFSMHGGPESDRERRDLSFDRYDRENPCNGIKQILTGFYKWSNRYISSCSGQKNFSHQAKRIAKWRGILNEGIGCNL